MGQHRVGRLLRVPRGGVPPHAPARSSLPDERPVLGTRDVERQRAQVVRTTAVDAVGVRVVAHPCDESRLVSRKTQTFCLEVAVRQVAHVGFHQRILSVHRRGLEPGVGLRIGEAESRVVGVRDVHEHERHVLLRPGFQLRQFEDLRLAQVHADVRTECAGGTQRALPDGPRLPGKGLSLAGDKPALVAWVSYDSDTYGVYSGSAYDLRALTLNVARAEDRAPVWQGRARGGMRSDAASGDLKKAVDAMLAHFPPK